MSQINFESVRRDHPSLAEALDGVEAWIEDHPDVLFLETDRLSRDLSHISAWDFSRALYVLANGGALRLKYRIRASDGALLDQIYSDVREIPEGVSDESIIPVFLLKQ